MKATRWLFAALASFTPAAFAAYTPYFTDTMASYQSAYWTQNGSISFGTQSGYPTQSGYGAFISKVSVPDGTASYDVQETLHNNLVGQYVLLLRASSNADMSGTGTYYAGQFDLFSGGGTFYLVRCVNGVVTTLGSTSLPAISDGMNIRMMINDSGLIAAYVNGGMVFNTTDLSITSGSPGVGYNCSTACSATNVLLGPADRIAPVSLPTITYAAYSNHVDFQVTGTGQDDTNGTGIAFYAWYRDLTWVLIGGGNWSDTTVQPGTEYTYTFTAYDYHWNTFSTTITVVTPIAPTGSPNPPDGHETGVRTTGTYWGAGSEQIDVLSGNVNYSIPLLKAVGRNGLTPGFNLTYNSQNWRSDSGGLWNLGADVGYGYGWKLLAGAVTPVYSGSTLSYYNFFDSTGASYRLNVNNGGVWSSLESIYIWLDTTANPYQLHFRDGTFWVLGCTSASGEADAGSLYPTTMESTDGNQIVISYLTGAGGSTGNTSARISQIQDVRYSGSVYQFSYTYGTLLPNYHLTGISNSIGTAETYSLSYATTTLQAPFSPYTSYGSMNLLSSVTVSGMNQQTSFTYGSNNSGEITYAYLPYGGYLRWDYGNVTYTNGATFRQIQTRYLSKDGVSATSYPFSHETTTLNLHSYTIIDDPGGVGEKYWAFSLSGANTGLVTQYQGRQLPGPVTLTQNDFTWAQDANGNVFIRSALTTQDPSQSYQAQKKTDQNVDVYGNVTQVFQFDFNSLSTPARIYTYTYQNSSGYTSRYILNRLTQATLTVPPNNQTTLVTNTYDPSFTAAPSGITLWDSAYASIGYRGDLASSTTPAATRQYSYDQAGTVTQATVNGVSTTVTASSTNNYSVPSQITVGSLSESMSWNTFLGLTSNTGPNTDNSTITYDSYGRPSTSTSVYGAQTTYTYSTGPYSSSSPAWSQAVIDGRFTKTILDGLGRTLTVQTGTGSGTTVVSQVDTVYGSCGCSPGGKMIQQSLPHAPGATPVWTTNSYDGIGRTTSVLSPDGASTTRYFYAGNTVTTTDAAGKWKKYSMDAFGNVTQVTEPDPTTSVTGVNALAVKSGMTNSVVAIYPATVSGGTWYNSSWGYRKSVTISHTMVSGSSSLTNFPVLVSVTDANLKTVANGGYVGKSDGTDILFTASDQITKLNHEIESYNASTGQVIAWVQIPSFSPSSDTVLYVYYGNASASNQQNATAVWDNNYKGVWHLPNGTTLTANDSTSNANNGTLQGSPTAVTGQIGGGGGLNGSSQDVGAGNSASLQFTGQVTLEAWANVSAFPGSWGYFIGKGYDGTDEGFYFRLNSSAAVELGSYNGTVHGTSWTISGWSTGTWHHLVGVYDGAKWIIYSDGSNKAQTTDATGVLSTAKGVYIGATDIAGTVSRFLNGDLDEVRISNSARSADWILTEYRGQSSPATYLSWGSQQTSGGSSQVAIPTFSQNGSTLTISDATSGATIYYTNDGSTPTTSSPVYSGPISLSTSTYGTTYTYDPQNHLLQVSMPRPSGTQTRTFVYNGNDLVKTTNPENGSVNYTYDSNHRVLTKTDAKGQQAAYTYDSYGRTTEVQRYYLAGSTLTEDTSQRVLYYYDSNPFSSTYSNYTAGRLAAMAYSGGNCASLGPPNSGCDTIVEMYNYNVGGNTLGKSVNLTRGSLQGSLNGTWTYDTEGRMTNVTYPSWDTTPGSSYTYAYDTMGRLNTMTNQLTTATLISGVTYGVANEVQAIAGSLFSETRTYNTMFQLTQITVPGALNIQYGYSSAMNNGKIASQTDVISGEQVVYTYDALNRLATAQTTAGTPQWGQSYNYDGFGNLTDQNVILGSAPTMHVVYNAATNRQTGDTADANGNLGSGYIYDIANRLLQPSGTTIQYAYDASNRRVWRGGTGLDEIAFWSPAGQKLATYHVVLTNPLGFTLTGTDVYFGARLVGKGTNNGGTTTDFVTLASVATDRLGSIGKFYPYGQERPSATTNDTEKFTGYFRDAATGLDYANQRYEQPGVGRFTSADPAQSSAGPSDPGSWNRYSYTRGDPVNRRDPNGTDDCDLSDWGCDGYASDDLGNLSDRGDGCAWSQYLCPGYIAGLIRSYCSSVGLGFDSTIESCVPTQTVQNGGGGSTAPPTVTDLQITSECWLSNNPKTGAPSLESTFTAYDGTTPLAGDNITITEAVTTSPGGRLATQWINNPASSGTGGVFSDEKGMPRTFWGPLTLYQSFTVSVDGGTSYSVPILMGGSYLPYLTFTFTWDYRGSLRNWIAGKKDYNVIVNGQSGNQQPACQY